MDLPGLSDAEEGRAAVARRLFSELALAVVVTPCVRAADERTGISLMDQNQEPDMRMNDKLSERGFCVVLSKIDDIDWKIYAQVEGSLARINKLQDSFREASVEVEEMTKAIKKISKLRSQLRMKLKRSK